MSFFSDFVFFYILNKKSFDKPNKKGKMTQIRAKFNKCFVFKNLLIFPFIKHLK